MQCFHLLMATRIFRCHPALAMQKSYYSLPGMRSSVGARGSRSTTDAAGAAPTLTVGAATFDAAQVVARFTRASAAAAAAPAHGRSFGADETIVLQTLAGAGTGTRLFAAGKRPASALDEQLAPPAVPALADRRGIRATGRNDTDPLEQEDGSAATMASVRRRNGKGKRVSSPAAAGAEVEELEEPRVPEASPGNLGGSIGASLSPGISPAAAAKAASFAEAARRRREIGVLGAEQLPRGSGMGRGRELVGGESWGAPTDDLLAGEAGVAAELAREEEAAQYAAWMAKAIAAGGPWPEASGKLTHDPFTAIRTHGVTHDALSGGSIKRITTTLRPELETFHGHKGDKLTLAQMFPVACVGAELSPPLYRSPTGMAKRARNCTCLACDTHSGRDSWVALACLAPCAPARDRHCHGRWLRVCTA
jgi:hypothetical protein